MRKSATRVHARQLPELFPEMFEPKLDRKERLPSCSAVEALERQQPFKQTLAKSGAGHAGPALSLWATLLSRRVHQSGHWPRDSGTCLPGASERMIWMLRRRLELDRELQERKERELREFKESKQKYEFIVGSISLIPERNTTSITQDHNQGNRLSRVSLTRKHELGAVVIPREPQIAQNNSESAQHDLCASMR